MTETGTTPPAGEAPPGMPPGSNGKQAPPVRTNTLPALTVPQWLAFVTFITFTLLAFVSDKTEKPDEYIQIRKLAVFLIAALLPSDAVIRFGRALFARGQADDPTASTTSSAPLEAMPMATVPQYLAFAAYVVVVLMTLVSNKWVTTAEFKQINDVAVFLISALLPSEAVIRFGRALYLRKASNVTNAHLKRI
jgi:hypothetical protein